MPREIKLPRVWDKVMKEMMLPAVWEEDYVGGGNKKIGLYIFHSPSEACQHSSLDWVLRHPESFEVMWPTGLKDKKDMEIYSGDILKFKTEDGSIKTGYITYWPNHMSFVIADGNDRNIGKMRSTFSVNERIKELPNGGIQGEIIGNIHQHPNFLTVKKP